MIRKTLVYKNKSDRKLYGKYVHFIGQVGQGGCKTPLLMKRTAKIKYLKKMYPEVDFSKLELIDVEIKKV